MSGESVARVEPALIVLGFELGKFIAVGFNKGLLILGNVLLQGNPLVLRRAGIAANAGLDLFDGKIEAARDERNIRLKVLRLLAQQEARDGGVVVDQDTALAVEDLAARGKHGLLADAIGLGELAIVLRA